MTPREALAEVRAKLAMERVSGDSWRSEPSWTDTDAAHAALEAAIAASETRSADIRDALERGLPDDAERRLSWLGARVVRGWYHEGHGFHQFKPADWYQLHEWARLSGVMVYSMGGEWPLASGVREAVDRLLAMEERSPS